MDEAAEAAPGGIIILDGYDEAIIGYAERFGMEPSICYDRDIVIRTIMRDMGIPREAAEEHFLFNIIGAHFGDANPVFLTIDPHLEH